MLQSFPTSFLAIKRDFKVELRMVRDISGFNMPVVEEQVPYLNGTELSAFLNNCIEERSKAILFKTKNEKEAKVSSFITEPVAKKRKEIELGHESTCIFY